MCPLLAASFPGKNGENPIPGRIWDCPSNMGKSLDMIRSSREFPSALPGAGNELTDFLWSRLDPESHHANLWNSLLPGALRIPEKNEGKVGISGIYLSWWPSGRATTFPVFQRSWDAPSLGKSTARLDGIWTEISHPNHARDLMKRGKTKRGKSEGNAGVFQQIHF